MARSYHQASADRRGALSEAARGQQAVFEAAYGMAMQITEWRERRGMTQAQLAEASGIDQGDISRIERGSINPTEKTLGRIAEALGTELRLVERAHP